MGFERGGVVVRAILVLWVFLVVRRARGSEGDISVLRGVVGGGDNVGIGKSDNLFSSARVGSSWCRTSFCDVSRGLI